MVTSPRIVVVEDNEDHLDVVVALLRQRGFNAEGFLCAEDVDDALGARPIDILLTDVNLPGESGLSLATRIRKAQPHVRVIMMTVRSRVVDRVNGYKSGADVYLLKPLATEELIAAVESHSRSIIERRGVSPLPTDAAAVSSALFVSRAPSILYSDQFSINLTDAELKILVGLARANDGGLENWQLIEVINSKKEITKENLEVRISRLRRKLSEAGFMGS